MLRGIASFNRGSLIKSSKQWQQCMKISSSVKLSAAAAPDPIHDPAILYTGVSTIFST